MSEPTRISPLPQAHTDRAITALVGSLEGDSFARLDYPPEPTTSYQLDDLRDAMRAARSERQQDPEMRRVITAFGQWREEVTRRRSENEARLSTLLWALDKAKAAGDTFAESAVGSYLRERWHVFDYPPRHERDTFARNVCAIECRKGVLTL